MLGKCCLWKVPTTAVICKPEVKLIETAQELEKVDLLQSTVLTDFGISPPALLIENNGKKWMLQTKEEGEILPWLKALEKSGVQCLEPTEAICPLAQNAKDIYGFNCKMIDGAPVNLDKYK
eukprot:sb/3476088/